VLFMIGAIALGIIGKRGEVSLMGGFKAPAAQPAPAPVPAPTSATPGATTPAPAPATAPEKPPTPEAEKK
jgi:hypothetical protein